VWPVSRLIPYIRNPRKNDSPEIIDRIASSIKEFGFKTPVLAKSDGTLIDGHLRLKGAIKLGLKQVPVLLCDEWTDAQVRSFRLLVNRSATWATFDEELLALEFADLTDLDFDLTLTGFDLSEIDKLSGQLAPDNPQDNWKGMPDFQQEDLSSKYSVIVHFAGQENLQEFARLVGQPLTDKTKSIWYPKAEIGHYADKRYAASESDGQS